MRRLLHLALALATALVAPLPAGAQSETTERQRAQLTDRLERLRDETAAAQARAEALGETLLDLAGDEAKLRERRQEIAERVATLEGRIAQDEETLARLTDEQAAIRNELADKRRTLSTLLMALQRIGRSAPPALLAEGASPSHAVRGAMMLNAALPELDREARALTDTLHRATRLAEAERETWRSLKADLEGVEAERARMDELTGELQRRRALSLYERDRAVAERARLAEEEATVSALLDRLSRGGPTAAPDAPAFADRRGSLAAPVAGRVVSRYGELTDAGEMSQGRTIAALAQSTVFAPMAATVLYSAPFRGYGHVLILDAGEGYHMVLAGMEAATVVPGDVVETGAPLGRMGRAVERSAALASSVEGAKLIGSRPALYVELRKDGAAIDSQGWWRQTPAVVEGTSG